MELMEPEFDATQLCSELLSAGVHTLSENQVRVLRDHLQQEYNIDASSIEGMCEELVKLLQDQENQPQQKKIRIDDDEENNSSSESEDFYCPIVDNYIDLETLQTA